MQYFIRIREWSKYQHYKDRNPPWIKLHRELLTSLTWTLCDDASRVLAIACMMLAAATDNKTPADPAYIKRVAYLNQIPDLSLLSQLEFIDFVDSKGVIQNNASVLLACCKQTVSVARPETETETETETEHKDTSSRKSSTDDFFEKSYKEYPRHTGKPAALKAWARAVKKGHEPDLIHQQIIHYAEVCQKRHKPKEFTPHMATWLNDERFMDDPSEWAVDDEKKSKTKFQEGLDAFDKLQI